MNERQKALDAINVLSHQLQIYKDSNGAYRSTIDRLNEDIKRLEGNNLVLKGLLMLGAIAFVLLLSYGIMQ